MFKTVNFNIFRENLQDIVYGKDSVLHPKNKKSVNEDVGKTNRNSTVVILKPLTVQTSTEKLTVNKSFYKGA